MCQTCEDNCADQEHATSYPKDLLYAVPSIKHKTKERIAELHEQKEKEKETEERLILKPI